MPSKCGHHPGGERGAVDSDLQQVVEEAEQHDPQQAGDRELEAPVAARLQREDPERHHGGHQAGGERWDAEQQVERDRCADELGEVGRDRDDLGLDPQSPGDRARQRVPGQLGQVAARGDADLGRQVLHEHRHQVRGDDHPHQQVAVLGAAGDVGGEVARVDVGDGGDERGPEEREAAADRALGARQAQRADLRRRDDVVGAQRHGGGVGRRGAQAGTSTRIASARRPPSTWTSSPKVANTGPPNGCLSTTSKQAPGAIPRSAR